jgi:hypothetical protein
LWIALRISSLQLSPSRTSQTYFKNRCHSGANSPWPMTRRHTIKLSRNCNNGGLCLSYWQNLPIFFEVVWQNSAGRLWVFCGNLVGIAGAWFSPHPGCKY